MQRTHSYVIELPMDNDSANWLFESKFLMLKNHLS